MKKINLIGGALLMGITLSSCQNGSSVSSNVKLTNEIDSVSYALGLNIGSGMAKDLESFPGGPVNKDLLLAGLVQSYMQDSAKYKMEIDSVNKVLSSYYQKMAEEEKQAAKIKNDAFLDEHKKQEGVIVTESGLQYIVLKEGNGPKPSKDDVVKVHYTGKLTDGTVFDSSIQRNQPAEFPVMGVIPGWSEALQLMPVGSKWNLTIPSDLAYGPRGIQGVIPPHSILQFEVELLEIVKK